MNIVLAHGILGFYKAFGFEYFNGVAEHLRKRPARVVAPAVSPTGGIAQRGEELRAAIWAALRDGVLNPEEKVHIIGHSMGGLDSRYLLSPANERTTRENDLAPHVATLTTISAPHRGSPIADLLVPQSSTEAGEGQDLRRLVYDLEGALKELLSCFGLSLDGVQDLTSVAMSRFNGRYPDHLQVRYLSCAGGGRPGVCSTAAIFLPLHRYIRARTGEPNDGLVTLSSARWGEFDPNLWPCDHVEEIGRDMDHPFGTARFDYLRRYDELADRMSGSVKS
jgi:triacylglycerol lipase